MISSARVAQLLGSGETPPGSAEPGDALERAVQARLPFTAVRRLIELGRLTTTEVTAWPCRAPPMAGVPARER